MKRTSSIAAIAVLSLYAALVAQQAPKSTPADPLKFFKNYFVTGDYVVGGIGVRGLGVNGIATGTIRIDPTGVPQGADILAAFLYWETVVTDDGTSGRVGATFNGSDISAIAKMLNPSGTAPCWSSGGGTGSTSGAHKLFVYRADVLRFMPVDPATGKHPVNGLNGQGFPVQLPDAGSGNVVPASAGASLVIVYRDPVPDPKTPLRAVVIYDGGYTLDQSTQGFTQTLKGFYQASTANPSFKLTHIVGDGQANFSDLLLFNNQQVGTNLFSSSDGPLWDDPTLGSDGALGAAVGSVAGSGSVTTAVTHTTSSFDCLSWGALVFSTTVQDTDNDGLLDIWETGDPNNNFAPVVDPNGQPLPDLKSMGASPSHKDIFIEVGYMQTPGYSNPVQHTVPAHSHLPTKAALDMVGEAFNKAPVNNPDGKPGVSLHFDVGSHYQTTPADQYIIATAFARGGESINETACVPDPNATPPKVCQFPDYPGTVGWKNAYRFFRDEPTAFPPPPAGTQPSSNEAWCVQNGPNCTRRFDRNRKDIFHYALFAHALGLPRSDDPNSPLFHIPKNTSGIADLLGGDILVTLGFWDNFVGSDFMQASTLMHELGHNLALRHGGVPLEPNCKPNYQSVMNYLFQARGMILPQGAPGAGTAVLDYSRQQLPSLNPNALSETSPFGPGVMLPYLTRWYAPFSSSFIDKALLTTPATHHCNGTSITENGSFVRVDGTTVTAPFDWNGNGTIEGTPFAQDITFNGPIDPLTMPFTYKVLNPGANDWSRVDLRQIGSRRSTGSKRIDGSLSLDVGFGDVGFGDVGFGDVGFGDVGFGDVGFGDVGFGDVGFGDVGFGDVGFGDVGTGDLGFGDVGVGRGDMDLDTAASLGNAPDGLTATLGKGFVTLRWNPPHVGTATNYQVYRVIGTAVTLANFPTRVLVGTTQTTSLIDSTVKNNVTYTYFVTASLAPIPQSDGSAGTASQSGPSNFATILVK